jgi:hypothetical protein
MTVFTSTTYNESVHGDLEDHLATVVGLGTTINGTGSTSDPDEFDLGVFGVPDSLNPNRHPNGGQPGATVTFTFNAQNFYDMRVTVVHVGSGTQLEFKQFTAADVFTSSAAIRSSAPLRCRLALRRSLLTCRPHFLVSAIRSPIR